MLSQGSARFPGDAWALPLAPVFDRAPVATVAVDARTFVVAYANDAMQPLSGLDPSEMAGLALAEVVPPQVAERLVALVRESGRSVDTLSRVELPHFLSADDDRCLSVSAWPILASQGERVGLVIQLEDVSDDVRERELRRNLASQMHQANEHLVLSALREQELTLKAEAANDAKSAFLAMMSHELRTPLTAIIGYEELLSDGISGEVNSEQLAQLGRIRHSAMHLLALVEQVLTLTRIELQGETVERERFTLSQLVRSVAVLVTPLATEKRLAFHTELPREDLVLESDPLRLKQALVNLLGNAVRFTDHGEVSLCVREEPGGLLAFEVRDTGIGIPQNDLERIFEPFWQVEQRATRRVGGAGLGLTVARRTARLLGGDVTVGSAAGEGSVFTLHVPRRAPDEASESDNGQTNGGGAAS
jgi:PAS domain S-box-containing protein